MPASQGIRFLGAPPTREAVLNQNPDLTICTDIPGSEYWPIDQLKDIAPTLPVDYELDWKDNLKRLGDWLDRTDKAEAFLAGYYSGIEATKLKYSNAIASKKVAALWFEPDGAQLQFLLGAGSKNVTLAGQVLNDLGGKTVDPARLEEYGLVSMENAGTILADVDAVIFDLGDDNSRRQAIEANELWGGPHPRRRRWQGPLDRRHLLRRGLRRQASHRRVGEDLRADMIEVGKDRAHLRGCRP